MTRTALQIPGRDHSCSLCRGKSGGGFEHISWQGPGPPFGKSLQWGGLSPGCKPGGVGGSSLSQAWHRHISSISGALFSQDVKFNKLLDFKEVY